MKGRLREMCGEFGALSIEQAATGVFITLKRKAGIHIKTAKYLPNPWDREMCKLS